MVQQKLTKEEMQKFANTNASARFLAAMRGAKLLLHEVIVKLGPVHSKGLYSIATREAAVITNYRLIAQFLGVPENWLLNGSLLEVPKAEPEVKGAAPKAVTWDQLQQQDEKQLREHSAKVPLDVEAPDTSREQAEAWLSGITRYVDLSPRQMREELRKLLNSQRPAAEMLHAAHEALRIWFNG